MKWHDNVERLPQIKVTSFTSNYKTMILAFLYESLKKKIPLQYCLQIETPVEQMAANYVKVLNYFRWYFSRGWVLMSIENKTVNIIHSHWTNQWEWFLKKD